MVVCITEGIPTFDMIKVKTFLADPAGRAHRPEHARASSRPASARSGSCPATSTSRARSASSSRSGTLTYEAVQQLTKVGFGQSTAVGIGGDPIVGLNFIELLKLFKKDPETEAVILIGEIGGTAEEEAAAFIKKEFNKPVVGFIAGQTAPPGRRMGHAGAIIAGGKGTAKEKMRGARGRRECTWPRARPISAARSRRPSRSAEAANRPERGTDH